MTFTNVLTVLLIILLLTAVVGAGIRLSSGRDIEDPEQPPQQSSVHSFTMKDIDGQEQELSQYQGKVLMLVNVASKCGYTYQYEALQQLYSNYRDQGFVVLAFPANNFGKQEPGSDSEIKAFCIQEYAVEFPMFSKISVKGPDQHPLYSFLTDKDLHPETGGKITWNFNKFLVNKHGRVSERFGTKIEPDDPDVLAAIDRLLAE